MICMLCALPLSPRKKGKKRKDKDAVVPVAFFGLYSCAEALLKKKLEVNPSFCFGLNQSRGLGRERGGGSLRPPALLELKCVSFVLVQEET